MKLLSLLLILLFSFTFLQLRAQENKPDSTEWEQKTLFNIGSITHGWYGAVMLRAGRLNNESSFMMGGKGAWIINHKIGIGIAGVGVMPHSDMHDTNLINTGYAGGYGGLLIEPIFFSNKLIHFSLPMIIGGGGITKYSYSNNGFIGNDTYVSFGVFEPGLEISLNMAKWFRVSLGTYYAFKTEFYSSGDLDIDALDPFSFGLSLKFGSF